jgi:tetratricopeptide (TPR) repeat protein
MISKISILLAFTFILAFSGCSNLVESTRKNLMDDSSPRKVKQDVKWVSKTQYDELMTKYKGLSNKYENLKDQSIKNKTGFNQLDELAASSASTETIDVFGKDGISNEGKPATQNPVQISEAKVDQELTFYKKAVALKSNGKSDEALKIFQFLDKSQTRQISVRAKRHIGDIYFAKKQYDLALQVFESIIRQNSFSGIVIKALEFAAKSSSELGLNDKKLKYESILRDFFEVRV